ncbi:MAG: DUF3536 domain-containing protein [Thermodesulfovibrionales bacterium]
MERYICIHGHFYQPPRENPWIEELEIQDSASPYHDWNEKITAECYAPNSAARLVDGEGAIIDILNNYAHMSFNFGPTLLLWMEKNEPEIYRRIIDSDRLSRERFSGHGSALAQVYNHIIMPLADTRDKRTQVIWGIRDFQKRFGRDPEGMWLAETAMDTETLDILAEQGIKYTILAPWQAKEVRKLSDAGEWDTGEWLNVEGGKVDPTTAYLCRLPSERSIALFFYEGSISYAVASAGLLKSGTDMALRLAGVFSEGREWPQLVHIANDGESYGHHHQFGDMALAACLHYIEENKLARLTNYGEFLEKHPPTHEVRVAENTSWSCIHGVERWKSDCGCSSGKFPRWNQKWRGPLRDALDELRDEIIPAYKHNIRDYLKDPWGARDDYIAVVLDRSQENMEEFLRRHSLRELTPQEKVRVLKLLEIQRLAMAMYTSCGWFYDEVSGIETVQILCYAAKAIQRAEEVFGYSLEQSFIDDLKKVPSNYDPDGAAVYLRLVAPVKVDLSRVGAHHVISSLFEECPAHSRIYLYTVDTQLCDKVKTGKFSLATGQAHIRSLVTWDEVNKSFAVLHLGDHTVNAGLRDFIGNEAYLSMRQEIRAAFERGDVAESLQLMFKNFGTGNYTLYHLFRDEQREIIDRILEMTHSSIEATYRQIYELNSPVMNFLRSLDIPIPVSTRIAAEHIVNLDMKRAFLAEEIETEKLERLVQESQRWELPLDRKVIGHTFSQWITRTMRGAAQEPLEPSLMERILRTVEIMQPLSLTMNLWEAQNLCFSLKKSLYAPLKEKAVKGDSAAAEWVGVFRRLAGYFRVKTE